MNELATGFSDFYFRVIELNVDVIRSASWHYFMPSENLNSNGNRWGTNVVTSVYVCLIDEADSAVDTCYHWQDQLSFALPGVSLATAAAATIAAVLF